VSQTFSELGPKYVDIKRKIENFRAEWKKSSTKAILAVGRLKNLKKNK